MWIGDNEGWLSIVKHLDKDDHLLVRARRKEHIKNIFPDANIYENMKADYPYRADIPKSDVISTMVERVDRIDYPNFKNSVKDKAYAKALNHVWHILWTYGADYRQFPEKWWEDEDWKE